MLDENLPVFFYKRAADGTKHHEAVLQSYQGSDPTPQYTLKHADPSQQSSKNCYAAALFDSWNPEVLFGEVLVQPTWTKPTLSQEDIRKNGGVPPPPQAIIPGEFTVQLYEPDQQVTVRRKAKGLASSTAYEFDMPMTSFRTPSVSALDRTQSDPLATSTTTKLRFVWRKESKLSKDYTCFLTGRSTDTESKKSKRDPDIAIALFRSLREITIYEPNLSRVDMEDLKGLELVLVLSAATIRDIYVSNNLREVFNIEEPPTRKLSSGGRKLVPTTSQVPPQPTNKIPTTVHPNLARVQATQQAPLPSKQLAAKAPSPLQPAVSGPANTGKDPRAQWQIDAETARLKAQVAAEEKEAARLAAQRKRDKEKADEAETKRLKKLFEAEQKEAAKQQKAVAEETERLRRKYGNNLPSLPTRPSGSTSTSTSNTGAKMKPQNRPQTKPPPNTGGGGLFGGSSSAPPQQSRPPVVGGGGAGGMWAPRPHGGGIYHQPNQSAYVMSGANGPPAGPSGARPKKSFWGLKELEEEMRRVSKKSSSLW